MSKLLGLIDNLKKQSTAGYWSERIFTQLQYIATISKIKGDLHDSIIDAIVTRLATNLKEDGTITKSAALQAESKMSGLSAEAKSYHMICAAHAHIDMNWMWSWDETVSITIDTFRTMLDLMKEYPEYKFSQSQASVYAIIEEYAPDMLAEIKARVKEGRWEITASHWV